jgi:hypothetical protein
MADYQFNTNLTPNIQGTNIADMVNLARGVQAYQQAEQANPLAIQRAKMEIEQAQKINPLAVGKSTEELAQAQIGTKEKQFGLNSAQTSALYGLAGGVRNDPRLKTGKKEDAIGVLHEAKQRASTFGIPEDVINGVFNPLFTLGKENTAALPKALDSIIQTGLGSAGQQALQSGAVVEINGVKYQYNPATGQATPLGANTPTPQPSPQPAPQPSARTTPQPPPSQANKLVEMDMPVSGAGITQMNAQQKERYDEGSTLKAEATKLAQAAAQSKQTTRKIKENIASAAGSAPGQALRSAGKYLAGSEQLDELVKNLAQNQVEQASLMGNSAATDAARGVLALANGSENITPQALAQIVQRADATSTALEKFNTGLGNYYKKAGSYNGPIHARNFKDAWAQNYDPRIFMVQNINSSDMSPAEKQLQLQVILKGTSEQERKDLAKKAEIIKRLEKGDF